jgi:hypothetical protein
MDTEKIAQKLIDEITFSCRLCEYFKGCYKPEGKYCKAQIEMMDKFKEILMSQH